MKEQMQESKDYVKENTKVKCSEVDRVKGELQQIIRKNTEAEMLLQRLAACNKDLHR